VPTSAPYKEPGDVVPMFTRDMFVNSQAGALSTARYYLDARNWAYATMNAQPFLLICDAAKCKTEASFYATAAEKSQHVVGARWSTGKASVLKAPASSGATWVVQTTIVITSGTLIDHSGAAVKTQNRSEKATRLYLRWSGVMWRLSDELVAT
jgi:hypothetical protein